MSRENIETRTRILNAAWKLLEQDNASSVRMSDIAKAAGISRQAVYLHFPNRAELLIATTRHLDAVHDVDALLAASRSAATGPARLDAYVQAWGNYIPKIHGVAKALMAMMDTDAEARQAWDDRMGAMREGCAAAVRALAADGLLAPDYSEDRATDVLWMMLSVRNWELLTLGCGWSQAEYIATMSATARRVLLA